MRGYAATNIFRPTAIELWKQATQLVERVAEEDGLRCHELTRAVGINLGLTVKDGQFGVVEHSWLLIDDYTILDVYRPGALPLVQLIDLSHALPSRRLYVAGCLRIDICLDTVTRIREQLRSAS